MTEESGNRVAITDVDMPFTSMVRFMVKWALASVPALFILMVLAVLFWSILIGVGRSLLAHSWRRSEPSADTSIARTTSAVLTTNPDRASGAGSVSPEAAAQIAYRDKIQVRNVRVSKSYLNETAVFGEVKNVGDRSLKEVEITIFCLGPSDKPVFEKTYHPVLVSDFATGDSGQPLKPGYSRQFGVKLDDAPSDWNKKVNVKVTTVEFQ